MALALKLPLAVPQLVSKLPPIVNGLMVVALANALAGVTWMIVPSPEQAAPPPLPQAARHNANQPVMTVSRDVANWHLFGMVQQELATPPPVPEVAPDTQLRLELKGVFASSDPRFAWAIISDASGEDKTYGIDEPLPGGAVLKEIHDDRIILLHNNRFETLRLPQDSMEGMNTNAPEPQRSGYRQFGSRAGSVTTVSPQAQQILRGYRDKLLNDPQSVMNVVRAEPYRKGGQLMGYRIFPGRDQALMGQVGLQPGDVVTSVNGISLDSPLKGLEVMKDLSDAREVTVDVLRNGVSQTFVVPVN